MPSARPDPQLLKFRDTVSSLVGCSAEDKTSAGQPMLAVAVSGGPDSMALLWLAAKAFPGRVEAATVDHGLRPEARAEADMVAGWCAEHGISHQILIPDQPISGSVQTAARSARYDLLHRWRQERGLDWLLTAHHADDQLETMLMRLNRSSGVGGLAAIRARNGAVLRPLLQWRRADLAQIVRDQALPHVLDPSNNDDRFDRVVMRKHLVAVDWIDPVAAARSAAACADADTALSWMVEQLAGETMSADGAGGYTLSRSDFPVEIQRRLVVTMLMMAEKTIGAEVLPSVRGDTLDRAIICLRAGQKMTIGNWLLSASPLWSVRPAPPRRGSEPKSSG